MTKRLGLGVLALALVGILAVAGCGSSGGGTTGATADAQGGGSTQNTGGSICATSLTSVGQAGEFIDGYKAAATKYGMEFSEKIANPEGEISSAQSNIQSCTLAGATIITGIATENSAVSSLIRRASEAGSGYIGESAGESVSGVSLNINSNNVAQSEELFEYAKKELASGGKPLNVYTLNATPLPVVAERIASFEELAKEAGWNIVGQGELDTTNFPGSATQKVSAALRSNPDIEVIVSPFDDPTAGAVAAIKQTGASQVKVLSYDGAQTTFAQMRGGNSPIAAIAGAPSELYQDVRLWGIGQILKEKLPEQTEAKCAGPLITDANIPAAGPTLAISGGSCVINEKEFSAAELGKMADEG
jgi:ABC-type sugar transport system substrate-binding protein